MKGARTGCLGRVSTGAGTATILSGGAHLTGAREGSSVFLTPPIVGSVVSTRGRCMWESCLHNQLYSVTGQDDIRVTTPNSVTFHDS